MEAGWLQDLLNWISANPGWSGLVIFVVAFIESLVVVGIFLPGIFILFGVGALIGLGVAETLPVWVGGSLGAFCGDIFSYWVGYRYQAQLRRMWPFSRYPGMLSRGTQFFRKHGAKSIVAGRFVGPLRPIIPASAGMLGMPLSRFMVVCIPACILWTPAYLLPGMLFGASLEVASEYAGRLALVVALAVGVVWLALWSMRLVYEIGVVYSARWLRRGIRWSRRHPVLGRLAGPILDPSQPEVLSVTMLGMLLVLALVALISLLFLSPFGTEPGSWDAAVMSRMQYLRNDLADPFMVGISQLSRWWVMLPTAVATLLWLLGAERNKAAAHWLVAMAGGMLLHWVMTFALRSVPTLEAAGGQLGYLPSAPMTMVTVVLGFFSIMVAKELRRHHRKWPYLAFTLLLTLLFIARIYLGLDWLSGALVGSILGLAWTAIVGMAYRTRAMRPFSGATASGIFYGTLALTMAWQVQLHLPTDLENLRIPLPERNLQSDQWWQDGWRELSRERTVSQSVAVRDFNIQLVGSAQGPAEPLRAQLLQQGWAVTEPAGWRWLLQSMNPNASERTLPLTGKNYQGYRELLVMRRPGIDPDRQEVLRLWQSGATLTPGGQQVLLGQYHEEALVKRLWFFSHWRAEPLSAGQLGAFADYLGTLQSRQASSGMLLIRPQALSESAAVPP